MANDIKKDKIEEIEFKIKRKFRKAANFKSHYVTGAIGGFKNKYDFRLSFYNLDTNNFILRMQNIKGEKGPPDEEEIKKIEKIDMDHNVVCEVIMSETAAKELYNFIGKELEIRKKTKEKSKKKDEEKNIPIS